MTDKTVALLPLKAHSERVPRKNFRSIAGKPLVKWVLDVLLSLDRIEKVVINTDARSELEDVGVVTSARVLIRDRIQSLRGDFVSMNRIIEDDLNNVDADHYLMTHTTNPLLSVGTIDSAITAYLDGLPGLDSLFSVNKFQSRFYSKDGLPINHDPGDLVRTQDLEPWYEENSCLYIFSRSSFHDTKARIGRRPGLFETPKLESVDIDEPEDWDFAETLLKLRQN